MVRYPEPAQALAFALIVILAVVAPGFAQEDEKETSNLALSIYAGDIVTGRALVTGYVDDIRCLPFIMTSEWRYDNSTHMLYAVTDSLISRSDSGSTLSFKAEGSFGEFHTEFSLPASAEIASVKCSDGLDSQISKSDGSAIIDVHGFDAADPEIEVKCRTAQAG